MIQIALHNPQIPQNTGNIARLAVGLDVELILVGKLGFSLQDRYLKRAGLDYWEHLKLTVINDFEEFKIHYPQHRIIPVTTKGYQPYYNFCFQPNDIILFGSETKGLPVDFIKENLDRSITIPMPGKIRSLNLSNSAAIIAYSALHQLNYFKDFKTNINFDNLFT